MWRLIVADFGVSPGPDEASISALIEKAIETVKIPESANMPVTYGRFHMHRVSCRMKDHEMALAYAEAWDARMVVWRAAEHTNDKPIAAINARVTARPTSPGAYSGVRPPTLHRFDLPTMASPTDSVQWTRSSTGLALVVHALNAEEMDDRTSACRFWAGAMEPTVGFSNTFATAEAARMAYACAWISNPSQIESVMPRIQHYLDSDAEPFVKAELMGLKSNLYRLAGQPKRALVGYRMAFTLLGDDGPPGLVSALLDWRARAYIALKDWAKAEADVQRALRIDRARAGDTEPDGPLDPARLTDAQVRRAIVWDFVCLGLIHIGRDALPEAHQAFTDALLVLNVQIGRRETVMLPTVVGYLADVAGIQRDFEQVEFYSSRALGLIRATYGERHPFAVDHLGRVAFAHEGRGQWKDAERVYREGLDIIVATPAIPPESKASFSRGLALILTLLDRPDEAGTLIQQALTIDRALDGPSASQSVGADLAVASHARLRVGDIDGARALLADAPSILAKIDIAETRRTNRGYIGLLRDGLGWLAAADGQWKDAEGHHRAAFAALAGRWGEAHHLVARNRAGLGLSLIGQGRRAEALPILAAARPHLTDEPALLKRIGAARP